MKYWDVRSDLLSDGSKTYRVQLMLHDAAHTDVLPVSIETRTEADAIDLCDALNRLTYAVNF